MSVPKSRRGESPAEYLDLAREIFALTYYCVQSVEQKYRELFAA
jgi:hypothetical protein